MKDLDIEKAPIQKAELQLALQLIDQISAEGYEPTDFEDEEKKRVLAAIDEKIAGKQIVVSQAPEPVGGQIIDLMDALRASLASKKPAGQGGAPRPQPQRLPPNRRNARPRSAPPRRHPRSPRCQRARAKK